MKFYISSRTKKASQTKKVIQKLKSLGYYITLDWTKQTSLKPYDKNHKQSAIFSKRVISAIKSCDSFILLTYQTGTGMHTELGIAIAEKKKIFIIGKYSNTNVFFFYPNVKRLDSINNFFKEIT